MIPKFSALNFILTLAAVLVAGYWFRCRAAAEPVQLWSEEIPKLGGAAGAEFDHIHPAAPKLY